MIIFGFHSIEARLKHQADSIQTLWLSESIRHQIRTSEFIELLEELRLKEDLQIKIQWSHKDTLTKLAQGNPQHQGIVAQVKAVIHKNWEDLLDAHPFYQQQKKK
jgi:tRNA G18 (ribose-2'-O)-methylase SpoU